MNKKIMVLFVLVGAFFFLASRTRAQATTPASAASARSQQASEQDIQLLRQDIRSKKKQLIAANLDLTDVEATKFWPVYDQFAADLIKINDQKYALLKQYAEGWGTITDAQALDYIQRSLTIDEQIAQLRIKYVPIVNKVLPGKKTATFFQLERRITMMIDIQLASQIPLVQDQK